MVYNIIQMIESSLAGSTASVCYFIISFFLDKSLGYNLSNTIYDQNFFIINF